MIRPSGNISQKIPQTSPPDILDQIEVHPKKFQFHQARKRYEKEKTSWMRSRVTITSLKLELLVPLICLQSWAIKNVSEKDSMMKLARRRGTIKFLSQERNYSLRYASSSILAV